MSIQAPAAPARHMQGVGLVAPAVAAALATACRAVAAIPPYRMARYRPLAVGLHSRGHIDASYVEQLQVEGHVHLRWRPVGHQSRLCAGCRSAARAGAAIQQRFGHYPGCGQRDRYPQQPQPIDGHQARCRRRGGCDQRRRHRQVPGHQPGRIAATHHRYFHRTPRWRGRAGHRTRLRPAVQHRHPQRPSDPRCRCLRRARPDADRRRGCRHARVQLRPARLRSHHRHRGVQDQPRDRAQWRHRCHDQHPDRQAVQSRRRGGQCRCQDGVGPLRALRRFAHPGSVGHLQLYQPGQDLRYRPERQLPEAPWRFGPSHRKYLEYPALDRYRPGAAPGRGGDQCPGDRPVVRHAQRSALCIRRFPARAYEWPGGDAVRTDRQPDPDPGLHVFGQRDSRRAR